MRIDIRKIKHFMPAFLTGIICLAIAIGVLAFPPKGTPSSKVDLSEYSSVELICEFATLKCYYHNVVVYVKNPEGSNKFFNDILLWPFGEYVNAGYKQFWMEYSGIVEAGIDATLVQISDPDPRGVVNVYIPDATILNVYADEDSLSEPLSEKGLFTSITGQDQIEAFAKAQSEMRQQAENDQRLLARARKNAKKLLERYIINTGKIIGVDYTINWVSNPL